MTGYIVFGSTMLGIQLVHAAPSVISIPHNYKVKPPVVPPEPAAGRTGQLSAAEGSGEVTKQL
jgi:hypothetical protein